MRARRALPRILVGLTVVALGRACLPQTTLPEPGELHVTTTASDALTNGFSTNDGWSVSFSRALATIGRASLEGDELTTYCGLYPDSRYNRIFDMKRAGAQKVALVYSLGHCDFSFALQRGSLNVVLGEGVTEADKIFMATPGSDAWAKNRGISLYLEGSATRESEMKTFRWSFRERVRYTSCKVGDADASVSGVSIASGSSSSLNIAVRGEAVFQNDVDDTQAELRFQPFADADDSYGNADGEVTLDELHEEPLDGFGTIPADAGVDAASVETFGDYVYKFLLPQVLRYRDTGRCDIDRSF